jgi:hypothetical protein
VKVFLFMPQFRGPIYAGTKCQTIRQTRKRPVYPGDALSLRQWSGRPYGSPQITLGTAVCEATMPVAIDWREGLWVRLNGETLGPEAMELFAVDDGFDGSREMALFWQAHKGFPFEGTAYQWTDFEPAPNPPYGDRP